MIVPWNWAKRKENKMIENNKDKYGGCTDIKSEATGFSD
jgi:hypothetical protein